MEADLLSLVSSPHWENIMNQCQSDFQRGDATRILPSDMNIDRVIGSGELDLERWITIDLETGRKSIG